MRKVAEVWILVDTILAFVGCGFLALAGVISLFGSIVFGLILIAIAALLAFLYRTIYVKSVKQRSIGWTITGLIFQLGSLIGMVGFILLLIDIAQNDK